MFAGFRRLLCFLHFNFGFLALGCVANRPEQPWGLDLALDEKVLGTLLQGAIRQQFVVTSSQYNQRDARRGCVRPPHSFQPLSVRQSKVEQDNVHGIRCEMTLRLAHTSHISQCELARSSLVEHFAQQPDIS